MIRNRVDFPVPLIPTTPIRSPSETVIDSPSKSTRSTRRTATCWRSTSRVTGRPGYGLRGTLRVVQVYDDRSAGAIRGRNEKRGPRAARFSVRGALGRGVPSSQARACS